MCAQVLLNVLADEIHRAHQRCLGEPASCDPHRCALPPAHGAPFFHHATPESGHLLHAHFILLLRCMLLHTPAAAPLCPIFGVRLCVCVCGVCFCVSVLIKTA